MMAEASLSFPMDYSDNVEIDDKKIAGNSQDVGEQTRPKETESEEVSDDFFSQKFKEFFVGDIDNKLNAISKEQKEIKK